MNRHVTAFLHAVEVIAWLLILSVTFYIVSLLMYSMGYDDGYHREPPLFQRGEVIIDERSGTD